MKYPASLALARCILVCILCLLSSHTKALPVFENEGNAVINSELFGSSSSGDNITNPDCSNLYVCSDCVLRLGCAWCSSSNTCEDVKVFRFYDNCKDWMWGQCSLKGKYVVAISILAVVLMLCVLALCICHCVKRRRTKAKKHKYDGSSVSEREFLVESGTTVYEEGGTAWRGITEKLNKDKTKKHVSWGPPNTINS